MAKISIKHGRFKRAEITPRHDRQIYRKAYHARVISALLSANSRDSESIFNYQEFQPIPPNFLYIFNPNSNFKWSQVSRLYLVVVMSLRNGRDTLG